MQAATPVRPSGLFRGREKKLERTLMRARDDDPAVTEIYAYNDKLYDGGAEFLSAALANNTRVTSLTLHRNRIEADGAVSIADVLLRRNSSLVRLRLRGSSVGVRGATAIAGALLENATLEELALVDAGIGNRGTRAIADSLRRGNSAIRELSLPSDSVGSLGAAAMADALRENAYLRSLDLSRNRIHADGAVAIADALRFNDTIVSLDLSVNCIGDPGAVAIAKCLRENASLRKLGLGANNISNHGAEAIADALRSNHTATGIILSGYIPGCWRYGARDNQIDGGLKDKIDRLLFVNGLGATAAEAEKTGVFPERLLRDIQDIPEAALPHATERFVRTESLSATFSFLRHVHARMREFLQSKAGDGSSAGETPGDGNDAIISR